MAASNNHLYLSLDKPNDLHARHQLIASCCVLEKKGEYVRSVHGKCSCLEQKTETELAKTISCKTDPDGPDSGCPETYFYLCIRGKCTCITK
ncbi:hypothetical protein Bca101_049105 [Brassica carinata]